VIYVVSPNMNPSRADPLLLEDAKNSLLDSYRSMLNAFWALKNGKPYIPKMKGSEKPSIFEMMMSSARDISTKSTDKRSKSIAIKPSSFRSEHWSNVLSRYCDYPETLSAEELYYHDDDFVIIWDKYPKAKKHLLVMPRKKIDGVGELKRQHLELVRNLKEKGQWVAERLKEIDPNLSFRVGFHAIPSMRQLHIHVISQDFISPSLKNKKHWNSFTTPFFKEVDEIENLLNAKGEIKFDKNYYESLLSMPLSCHLCNEEDIKNIPTLKRHLEEHWNRKINGLTE
ncbi:1284_t:CDS:2, partial [Acaulospora morrowiae]